MFDILSLSFKLQFRAYKQNRYNSKMLYDVAARPLVNQIVKIGTNRQDSFNADKYTYDLITRGITTLAPSLWKPFYRGATKSIWDLNKRNVLFD